MTIFPGSKYYTYVKDDRYVVRVISVNDNTVLVKLSNGNIKNMDRTLLENVGIRLIPDAICDIMIGKLNDDNKDVCMYIYRLDEFFHNDKNTYDASLLLRNDHYSAYKNEINANGNVYVGECCTKLNNPYDGRLIELSEFKSIESTYKFDIYLNDTIDDIISCIPYKYLSEINNVLKATYDRYSTYANVLGASEDIKSLMVNNNFMYNFRSIYNIYQVNWPGVYDDKLSHNSNGNIILNNKQVKFLEDMLQKHIDNINVIEYDKDINVKDIINYNHILISDSTEKIYLITYDIISDYPIDEDILKTLHLNV